MPKYYRVRTQEQWDWLMQWFEKQDENIRWVVSHELPTMFNAYDSYLNKTVIDKNDQEEISYSGLDYFQQNEGVTDFIEVSQMMEESKMEDYLVIESADLNKIRWGTNYGQFGFVDHDQDGEKHVYEQYLPADLYIPKSLLYPKVKFTEEEKREFNDIKKHVTALYNAMVLIFEHRDECINLNNKLFYSAPPKYLNDVQRDFARAWTDPSLIDVIPEKKYWVKCYPTDDCYFYKYDGKILAGVPRVHLERFHFTAKEITDYHLDGNTFEKVEVGDAKEN